MPALRLFLLCALAASLTGLTSCANKSSRGQVKTRRIVLEFSVEGSLALNNPNVTYYVVLNSPEGQIQVASESAAATAATPTPEPTADSDVVCPEGQEPAPAESPVASVSPDVSASTSPTPAATVIPVNNSAVALLAQSSGARLTDFKLAQEASATPTPGATASSVVSPKPETTASSSVAPSPSASATEEPAVELTPGCVLVDPNASPSPSVAPTPSATPTGATNATTINVAGLELDPSTQGPRGNGPVITEPATNLIGRLPFTGFIQGLTLVPSVWTDFYYIHGNSSGNPVVGRGANVNGIPQKEDLNYSPALFKKVDNSTFELQILFSDIFPESTKTLANPTGAITNGPEVTIDSLIPKNVVVNIVVGDSIDSGQGFVYDSWQLNQPFSIPVAADNSPNEQFDNDSNLNLVPLPVGFRNPFAYPPGVGTASLNITKVRYRVVEF